MGRKEKSKLSIIGIVILAIIVFIIASITYTYVESIRIRPINEIDTFIEGKIVSVYSNDTLTFQKKQYPLYQVTIEIGDNDTFTQQMFFYDLYPPLEDINVRMFFDPITKNDATYYRIVRVEMI